MRGPWDRQDHFAPSPSDPAPARRRLLPRRPGADDFKRWLSDHPADKAAFESLTTVIQRTSTGLTAVPYSKAYREWLEPAAELLLEAAATTRTPRSRSSSSRAPPRSSSDDYYQSDKDWMDLDSPVEITIGPYETYEDELLGLKASFEAFVTISDPKASADLARFKNYLPDMEKHLPIPDEVKTKRGSESPIRVVDLVFSSGEARKSVQTIAFNLPNDEKVRAEKGAKKVLLRNLIATKFNIDHAPDRRARPRPRARSAPRRPGVLSGGPVPRAVAQPRPRVHHEGRQEGRRPRRPRGQLLRARGGQGRRHGRLQRALHDRARRVPEGHAREAARVVLRRPVSQRPLRRRRGPRQGRRAADQPPRRGRRRDRRHRDRQVQGRPRQARGRDLRPRPRHLRDPARRRQGRADALLAKYGVVSPAMQRALDSFTGIPVDIRPHYPIAGEILPK
jgi:hypothetical protein